MITLQLTNGGEVIVDDDTPDAVTGARWFRKNFTRGGSYACRTVSIGGKFKTLMMHRVIMAAPAGLIVDHVNGNAFDNRRENLRIATHGQNSCNKRAMGKGTIFKGISFRNDIQKWGARIALNGRLIHLGHFVSPEDAARAFDEAARMAHGAYGRFNFPRSGEQSALKPTDDEGDLR